MVVLVREQAENLMEASRNAAAAIGDVCTEMGCKKPNNTATLASVFQGVGQRR